MINLPKEILTALNKRKFYGPFEKETKKMVNIHLNHDGSIALDMIISENSDFEMSEIIRAVELHVGSKLSVLEDISIEMFEALKNVVNILTDQAITTPPQSILDLIAKAEGQLLPEPKMDYGDRRFMVFDEAHHAPSTKCRAVQQSDEMFCVTCNLRWYLDDAKPPQCAMEELELINRELIKINMTGKITGRESEQYAELNKRKKELGA